MEANAGIAGSAEAETPALGRPSYPTERVLTRLCAYTHSRVRLERTAAATLPRGAGLARTSQRGSRCTCSLQCHSPSCTAGTRSVPAPARQAKCFEVRAGYGFGTGGRTATEDVFGKSTAYGRQSNSACPAAFDPQQKFVVIQSGRWAHKKPRPRAEAWSVSKHPSRKPSRAFSLGCRACAAGQVSNCHAGQRRIDRAHDLASPAAVAFDVLLAAVREDRH